MKCLLILIKIDERYLLITIPREELNLIDLEEKMSTI